LQRTRRGMELIEVAPGIDVERDILAQMDFRPIVEDPKLMDWRIFGAPPMGLEQVLLGLGLNERLAYDEARNTLFINFEGFHIRTTDDVELVRREVERTCRSIGRKVHLVANYDGCQIDPMVADAYFSMITYMQNRYYETASRYTTSAFMRLKLGEALKDRDVAPHVFETRREAQSASESALQAGRPASKKPSGWKKAISRA
jgi:propionate CoA-transferase